MTHVTFYEKPGCGNNNRQKIVLREAGHQLEVRDLLSWAWTPESLRPFFTDKPVTDWFNRASPRVKSGEIDPARFDETSALAAMVQDPLLIRRPLMEALGRRSSGFDQEAVKDWIGLSPTSPPAPEICSRGEDETCAVKV